MKNFKTHFNLMQRLDFHIKIKLILLIDSEHFKSSIYFLPKITFQNREENKKEFSCILMVYITNTRN